MEFLYSQIKKMDVVSVTDGKNLGKVCDVSFLFPENRLKGFFVTGARGFKFSKSDVFVPMSDVVKIGEDVILVKQGNGNAAPPNCPPQHRPCPPQSQQCSPQSQPPRYPTQQLPHPPQQPSPRRNYDEYE